MDHQHPTSDKISILMPVYNTAPYLHACLDSICKQTYKNWELIAIDDHSTDDSRRILEEYAGEDPRIHWYSNDKKGIIPALQLAYRKSQGRMIHRMDSDDIMSSDKLKSLHELLSINDYGVVATGKVEYFSTDHEIQRGFQDYANWINQHIEADSIFKDIFMECPIASPAWLMYRQDIEAIGGVAGNQYPEDYDLVFRMYIHGLVIRGCNKVIHYWRDWSDRASRSQKVYADQLFFDLKIGYFFRHKHKTNSSLVIWGAGRKGKKLFRKIQKSCESVDWVTDNPKKIGQEIYGTILQDPQDSIHSTSQVIIAVSDPIAKNDIRHRLESYGKVNNEDMFFFC